MQDILNRLKENLTSIPNFIAYSVTDLDNGESLDNYTVDPTFDPSIASAYNLEVVKSKLNAIKALDLKESIEEITITLKSQIHIISIAPSNSYFIYLAIKSESTNVGLVKALLNKHRVELNEAL
ncbi:conserved hypothetical protein [Tenacibaculum litopenaei]|jgi:hypothetical protein|uniref:hypothetical protein n=1 Tax=Tenacibaculum litopenaei TaxID=396016 RepID=UPI00389482C3